MTQGQKEALAVTARGMQEDAAAYALGLTVPGLKWRLRKARETLGARTTAHAVAIAVARGLVEVE